MLLIAKVVFARSETQPIQKQTETDIENVVPEMVATVELPPKREKIQPVAPVQATGNLQQWLLDLRTCEAGGDYTKNTGNGYYGAYQFSQATWDHWQTGYARADLAPASVQDATIIINTNGTAGLVSQNPGCMKKMGLSNKPPKE